MSVILGVMSVTQRFREPKQLGQTSEKFNVTEENFEHLPIKKIICIFVSFKRFINHRN